MVVAVAVVGTAGRRCCCPMMLVVVIMIVIMHTVCPSQLPGVPICMLVRHTLRVLLGDSNTVAVVVAEIKTVVLDAWR